MEFVYFWRERNFFTSMFRCCEGPIYYLLGLAGTCRNSVMDTEETWTSMHNLPFIATHVVFTDRQDLGFKV